MVCAVKQDENLDSQESKDGMTGLLRPSGKQSISTTDQASNNEDLK